MTYKTTRMMLREFITTLNVTVLSFPDMTLVELRIGLAPASAGRLFSQFMAGRVKEGV